MNEILFTETSSQRIFCLSTKTCTSSWLTLASPKSSAKSHLLRPFAEPPAMSPLKFLPIPSNANTPKLSIFGLLVLCCTSAFAVSLHSLTSSTLAISLSLCHNRFEAVDLTTPPRTGILLVILLVSQSHPIELHLVLLKCNTDKRQLTSSTPC